MQEIINKPKQEVAPSGGAIDENKEAQIAKLRALPTSELAKLAEAAARQDSTFVPGAEIKLENVGTRPDNVVAPEIRRAADADPLTHKENLNDFLNKLNGNEKLPSQSLGSFMDGVLEQSGNEMK